MAVSPMQASRVSNAARAGVAYGAQSTTTASDINNIRLAATQDAPNLTGMTAVATQACSCESAGGAITPFSSCSITITNLATCPNPSRIIQYVQVQTTASVPTLFHFPGIASTVTLRGQALMRVEQ